MKDEAHGHGHEETGQGHGHEDTGHEETGVYDDSHGHAVHEEPVTDVAAAAFEDAHHEVPKAGFSFRLSMVAFIACNFGLGIFFIPIMNILSQGIDLL